MAVETDRGQGRGSRPDDEGLTIRSCVVLSPGDVVYCPEGIDGLHTLSNPADEPARILAVSTKRFPDVVAYPERGIAWVATRHPERPVPEGGDKGIIARFELPKDE
jgi:uncharacterized cupin superfamily protein